MADQEQPADDTVTFEMTSPDNFQTIDAFLAAARDELDAMNARLAEHRAWLDRG